MNVESAGAPGRGLPLSVESSSANALYSAARATFSQWNLKSAYEPETSPRVVSFSLSIV